MSQENVDSFKRATVHFERRDVEGVLEELDPQVEWYPAFTALVGGEKSMYRGHDGARELMQEYWDVFSEAHFSVSEIRDLGDQVLAVGTMRVRGAESGAEIESPWAWLVRSKQGKAVSVRAYTDPAEALEAAGAVGENPQCKKLQKQLKKAKEAKNKQKVKKIRKKMRKLGC